MTRTGKRIKFKRMILWVDMEKNLKPNVPPFLKDAIKTMADFQRWLFKTHDPKREILKIMKAREIS